MTTFATPEHDRESSVVAGMVATQRTSRRDRFEAVGLLLGMLGILLGLALTVGGSVPLGQ